MAAIVCVAVTSCVTLKQRERICATCTTHDSTYVHDTTIVSVHDTTIKLGYIHGPVSYLPSPCQALCDSIGQLKPYTHTERHNGLVETLKTEGNVLVQECDADSLEAVIKVMQRDHDRIVKSLVERAVEVNVLTKWQSFGYVSGLALWIILVIYALFRLAKFVLKKYFPLLRIFK